MMMTIMMIMMILRSVVCISDDLVSDKTENFVKPKLVLDELVVNATIVKGHPAEQFSCQVPARPGIKLHCSGLLGCNTIKKITVALIP